MNCNIRSTGCHYQCQIQIVIVPKVFGTTVCIIDKRITLIERGIPDARHTVGDCDTRQFTAIRERRISNACHTVGDCDTRQFTAIRERIITDTRHTVGNIHAFKITAINERLTTDTRYRFAVIFGGNHNIRNILVYPCYGITFAIIIQGVFQGGFLTAYSAVAVRKVVFGISVFLGIFRYGAVLCRAVMPMMRFVSIPSLRPTMGMLQRISAAMTTITAVIAVSAVARSKPEHKYKRTQNRQYRCDYAFFHYKTSHDLVV